MTLFVRAATEIKIKAFDYFDTGLVVISTLGIQNIPTMQNIFFKILEDLQETFPVTKMYRFHPKRNAPDVPNLRLLLNLVYLALHKILKSVTVNILLYLCIYPVDVSDVRSLDTLSIINEEPVCVLILVKIFTFPALTHPLVLITTGTKIICLRYKFDMSFISNFYSGKVDCNFGFH